MGRLLRRLRGLLSVGLTWGTLWAGVGALIGVVFGLVYPGVWDWSNPVLEWAVGMGLYGAVSGVGFGTLLSAAERRKTILDLSLSRVAFWGVLGSAVVPPLFGLLGMFGPGTTTVDVLQAMAVTGVLGGTFASGSVAMARKAELGAGGEPGTLEAGPTSGPVGRLEAGDT